MTKRLLSLLLIGVLSMTPMISSRGADDFSTLQPDQVIASFKTECVYVNELGQPMGGRFRHLPSGFVLDLLRIQSLPQAFSWVNSVPPSDQGEPHTCEHLLLGKGTKGRYVASLEDMMLGQSSAFTEQLQTCYDFNCGSGNDAFFKLFEAKLDALLHPNYSDEEIRREVCNIGYDVDRTDSSIRLEEKGTVYNEMVRTFESPWGNLMLQTGRMIYGPNHPLSYESGGQPDAIRTMVPADLRRFQEGAYHLNNMGTIVSIADDISLSNCLEQVSALLKRVEPDAKIGDDPALLDSRLPKPKPEKFGMIAHTSFPAQDVNEPGLLVYSWPGTRDLNNNENYLLQLLVANLAADQTSILHKKFIDTQTRVKDVGASAVFSWVSYDLGQPVFIGFDNIKHESCNDAMIDTVRGMILSEISKIASYADGSKELKDFNDKALSRVISRRRDLRKFLNSPPSFGERNVGSEWLRHVQRLQKTGGFKRSLILDDELKFAGGLLAGQTNFWKDYITKWHLLDQAPYAVAATADPTMIKQTEDARSGRLAAFTDALKKQYNVTSDHEALAKFKSDYDVKTAEIDKEAAKIKMPEFVNQPPMTLDDQLNFKMESLPGGGQLATSTFNNITSTTVGLAFNMTAVPESLLVYCAALPSLLTDIGVNKGGVAIPYDDMREQVRKEILELDAYYSVNYRTERVDLVIKSAGSDASETSKALDWLSASLFDADLTPKNLPRIRDAVDQLFSDQQNVMRGPEEAWVNTPIYSYWKQSNPMLLSTSCFLTKMHSLHRLRWMLKEGDGQQAPNGFAGFMQELSVKGAALSRENLNKLLAQLTGKSQDTWDPAEVATLTGKYIIANGKTAGLIKDAAEDLQSMMANVPEETRSQDWQYLCAEIAADAAFGPEKALDQIKLTLNDIRHADNVRGFIISNSADHDAAMPKLSEIIGRLDKSPTVRQKYSPTPILEKQLKERAPQLQTPLYVGLVNEETRSGVILNTADCASYNNYTSDKLLDFLSARLYGGGGAHSMFMKTWSAGLAYSNGLRSNESNGRIVYYAERCPDVAQTMQFVVSELKKAQRDPELGNYAVAQAFSDNRAGSGYEYRGESMANNMADGITPEKVKAFRRAILDISKTKDFYDKIQARMESVYGLVLPDYGPSAADAVQKANAINFIIGPEKQFESYERYLHSVEGEVNLYRIYPRDYWIKLQLKKTVPGS